MQGEPIVHLVGPVGITVPYQFVVVILLHGRDFESRTQECENGLHICMAEYAFYAH